MGSNGNLKGKELRTIVVIADADSLRRAESEFGKRFKQDWDIGSFSTAYLCHTEEDAMVFQQVLDKNGIAYIADRAENFKRYQEST